MISNTIKHFGSKYEARVSNNHYITMFVFLMDIFIDVSLGLSTSHFAWAFHSVAEEELLNMLPAMQKDDPTWSELRAMGVGWWVRSNRILRKCIEKVSFYFFV